MSRRDREPANALDHELDRRIVRSSAWVGLGHGGGQILSFASTLVLVRLLEPQAFGLVAVGMTLLAAISQIQESGLGAALVHGRHRDPKVAASSVLVFAAAAGFALTAVTIGVAPLYTRLLHVPEATQLVQVLALLLAVRGLAVVPGAMLERELDFRARTVAELAGALVHVVVAISCAVEGLGAWSLVAGQLAGSVCHMVVLWLRVPWRPSPLAASRSTVRELLRYGRFVSGTNVMVIVNNNLDNAVVARFLGAGQLGVYNLAWRLASLPSVVIGVIVGRVMFSVYSRLQDDVPAVRIAYIQNLQRTMLLALPFAVILGLAAEPVVLGLLGADWKGAIGPLRLLAIFGLVRLLVSPSGELLKGVGRPDLTLVATTAFLVVTLPALLVLVPWLGSSGAALGMLIGIAVSGSFLLAFTFRVLFLHPFELARELTRPAACAAVMAFALGGLIPWTRELSSMSALLVVMSVGTITYIGAVAVLARPLVTPIIAGLRRA